MLGRGSPHPSEEATSFLSRCLGFPGLSGLLTCAVL